MHLYKLLELPAASQSHFSRFLFSDCCDRREEGEGKAAMCGILAVFGCIDNSQAKRSRIIELSRRYFHFSFSFFVSFLLFSAFGFKKWE